MSNYNLNVRYAGGFVVLDRLNELTVKHAYLSSIKSGIMAAEIQNNIIFVNCTIINLY